MFLALSLVSFSRARAQTPGLPPILQRLWLSGQSNITLQGHPAFRSSYEGPNSFRSGNSGRVSQVVTLYTGLRVAENTSVLFNLERTSGANLSRATGMAGFPNLDTVSMPDSRPYVARALLHHSIGLGGGLVQIPRGPLQLAQKAAGVRLDIYAGKFSLPDFFDVNAVGGDNHFQFSNWSINNNATYGYPSDTRGYTYGAVVEYHYRDWTARFAEALQAKADNPDKIDFQIGRSHSEHFELESPLRLVPNHVGLVRGLAFVNHGPLALYRDAISATGQLAGHRSPRRTYGFGLTAEQELTPTVRVYGRLGWAQGKIESRNNTEADGAASGGFDLTGDRWHRLDDKFGAAVAMSTLALDHRAYLAMGGIGAVLGDGRLHYGKEKLVEIYYTARVKSGVYVTADLQRIWNPGYNQARGPVTVVALRLHLEAAVFREPR
jgi:hypothetical protein